MTPQRTQQDNTEIILEFEDVDRVRLVHVLQTCEQYKEPQDFIKGREFLD